MVGGDGKCLGFCWRKNLMANRYIEESLNKAMKAFFDYGSICAFQEG